MTYYTTEYLDNTPTSQLIERWNTAKFHKIQTQIIDAIVKNSDLPDETPTVEVIFFDKTKHILCDLRGIDLSELNFWTIDLSYCAFDHANLSNCVFNHTSLQYSTFKNANMENVKFRSVQASPIDAQQANFKSAIIEDSFLTNSNFDGADFTGATFRKSPTDGSSKKSMLK